MTVRRLSQRVTPSTVALHPWVAARHAIFSCEPVNHIVRYRLIPSAKKGEMYFALFCAVFFFCRSVLTTHSRLCFSQFEMRYKLVHTYLVHDAVLTAAAVERTRPTARTSIRGTLASHLLIYYE